MKIKIIFFRIRCVPVLDDISSWHDPPKILFCVPVFFGCPNEIPSTKSQASQPMIKADDSSWAIIFRRHTYDKRIYNFIAINTYYTRPPHTNVSIYNKTRASAIPRIDKSKKFFPLLMSLSIFWDVRLTLLIENGMKRIENRKSEKSVI